MMGRLDDFNRPVFISTIELLKAAVFRTTKK